jgi:hypothetical protein
VVVVVGPCSSSAILPVVVVLFCSLAWLFVHGVVVLVAIGELKRERAKRFVRLCVVIVGGGAASAGEEARSGDGREKAAGAAAAACGS